LRRDARQWRNALRLLRPTQSFNHRGYGIFWKYLPVFVRHLATRATGASQIRYSPQQGAAAQANLTLRDLAHLNQPEVASMHARMSKPDSVTVTVLLFTLGTLLTATLNVMIG